MPGAGLFTPGPIEHFVLFRGQSTANYLGSAVVAPDSEGEKFKLPMMNDLSGRSVPFQIIQDGEQWMVMTTMNRFDLSVARALRALESGGAGLGQESGIARGTLQLGVNDFSLILFNSYYNTPSAGINAGDLNPYRGFYSGIIRKYKESTAGSRIVEVSLAIECNNLFNPVTRGFSLYSEVLGTFNLGPVS